MLHPELFGSFVGCRFDGANAYVERVRGVAGAWGCGGRLALLAAAQVLLRPIRMVIG